MARFSFNFSTWVWQHLHPLTVKLGLSSIWARLLKALTKPIETVLVPIANTLYDQLYLTKCSGESLDRHAALYDLARKTDESNRELLDRILLWKIILRRGGTIQGVKSIIALFIGVDAEIIQEFYMEDVFTIGVTALGTGKSVASDYLVFVFKIILPDLSGQSVDHAFIVKKIDEFSPHNEFIILENRPGGYYEW
ncbi:MAG: hypothetical protein EPN93_17530 [Spirochaetes bacterium]|nr:MAG: hypothetical protein EPN93_17530 [Spirochaetota bacterium]